MTTFIIGLVFAVFIYIVFGLIATYGYYNDKKYKEGRVPWFNYDVPVIFFFIFWLFIVILAPVAHGVEELADETASQDD